MNKEEWKERLFIQRDFFSTGITRNVAYRKKALQDLFDLLVDNEQPILEALHQDLGKSAFEGYACELGLVLHEIQYCLRRLSSWSRPQRKRVGRLNFPAQGWVYPEPYGVVLILAPWNYPLNLCLMPLVGAIAAGNCVCLKTSEFAAHTSNILAKLLGSIFEPSFVQVIPGRNGISEELLKIRFDYIFFTGSPAVGKKVMRAAAEFLTPITLELGGKSPCLVCDDCDMALAARRIVWGKLLNAGQTCVAPDYILVSSRSKPLLIQQLTRMIHSFYGNDPLNHPDYPKIIHRQHFHRLVHLLQNNGKLIFGGEFDEEHLKINPAILDEVSWEDPIMQEEIFGPIFPIITCNQVDEMIHQIQKREKPLALYLFTKNRDIQHKVVRELSFGGGCINDTVMHLTSDMPFGGVGNSGMGHYHGRYSFVTFSHEKSILKKSTKIDVPLRYPPYRWPWQRLKKFFQ